MDEIRRISVAVSVRTTTSQKWITFSTGQVQELAEEVFGTPKRVRAVSFYPKKTLYPGEVTDVLIMTSKSGGVK